MNPFQRAREEAAKLRQKLLLDRAELPVHATELLDQIEPRLNLGVEEVPEGSSELGGGDACLQRTERYIYVKKGLSPEKHAQLVAHELGHFDLDANKTPMTVATLKSLACLDGTPAVVKVESYGARERQELQANVFGRELLLPRALARDLFAKGLGARKVAHDLGLSVDLVQQQMLDAVLLPQSMEEAIKDLPQPSGDQSAAAKAEERFVNVVAGPGTGKTSTLIHRVKYLIEKKHVDPSHILVLTFTNKAAFELVERLRHAGIERAADIWAGTFHAFGLEFLRKYHQCFDLESDISVADRLNAVMLLCREIPNIDLKHYLRIQDPYEWLGGVVQAIHRLKEEMVSPEEYRRRLPSLACKDDDLRARREDVAMLYDSYEKALRRAGTVDFVDLVALPARAIREDRARYSELADKFQYVLVDEYQDVTEAMVALVKQLAHKAKSLWVVGDVRQAIHHWRGASVKSLIVFEKTFQDQASSTRSRIRKYPLQINRRSSQEILDLVTNAGRQHVLEAHLPLDEMTASAGSCGDGPILVSCANSTAIPSVVETAIRKLVTQGTPYGEQAVLCRRSADLEHVAKHLHAAGIPVLHLGELTQRPEIKTLLCLMQLLVERQPRALIGLATQPRLRVPLADVKNLMAYADEDIKFQRGRWLKQNLPVTLSKDALSAIANLSQMLRGHSRHSTPWSFICDMVLEHRVCLPPPEDTSIASQITRIALWQFAYSVRTGDGDRRISDLSRYLIRQQLRRRIGETYAERDLPPEASSLDAVRIQTVHGSKGLEYWAVHVAFIDDSSYGGDAPTWSPEDNVLDVVPPEALGSTESDHQFEQSVERNNLFYVALSRAKRRLLLYEDAEWSDRNRPPQLNHQPLTYRVVRVGGDSTTVTPTASAGAIAATSGPITFAEFEVFARCPLEHHYRFRLGLKREQELDAPLRARLAIMSTLERAAKEGNTQNYGEALVKAWDQYRLPKKEMDQRLWQDSDIVVQRGLRLLKDAGGHYTEPRTSVGGLQVQLPWMLASTGRNGTPYMLLRIGPHGAQNLITLLRPMLNGLSGSRATSVGVATLLAPKLDTATQSGNVTRTKAYSAAKRYLAGDLAPAPGRACRYCAYLTICPTNPS